MATYRVTAAAVLVRLTGADLIVERGQELPAQAPADLVDRLLRKGMIEPIGAETPEPAVEPDAPAPRKGRTPPRGKPGAPADSGKELADLTVDQLRAEAAARGIEVPEGVTDPADLIALLEQ